VSDDHRERDFGLTGLMQRFHEEWGYYGGTGREVVAGAAAEYDGAVAGDILADAVRLVESPLTADVLMTLWVAATGGNYNPQRLGMDGRKWLTVVVTVCVEQVRQAAPGFVPTAPEPVAQERAADVLAEIDDVASAVTRATESSFGREVSAVVPALRLALRHVGPDLAFRLLLRILDAYQVDIGEAQYGRYEDLGAHFGFGADHVSDVQHLVWLGRNP
jgi:hypothetical protein